MAPRYLCPDRDERLHTNEAGRIRAVRRPRVFPAARRMTRIHSVAVGRRRTRTRDTYRQSERRCRRSRASRVRDEGLFDWAWVSPGARIRRTVCARQYLHADQQICIVRLDGHIISIKAHATPAPHTSATTRALRSADARRRIQTDRTAGRQPDDAGGNRRLVRLQPRTRQPSLRIEGRAGTGGDRTPPARFRKNAGAGAGGAAWNGSAAGHGGNLFALGGSQRSQCYVRVDRRGAWSAARDSGRDGRSGPKISEIGAEVDRGRGAARRDSL